jgi:hypothetical protein
MILSHWSKHQRYRKKLIKELYKNGSSIIPLNREEQNEATANWRGPIRLQSKKDWVPLLQTRAALSLDLLHFTLKLSSGNEWLIPPNNMTNAPNPLAEILGRQRNQPFNGDIPPFLGEDKTYAEWDEIKRSGEWADEYVTLDKEESREFFKSIGWHFLQIEGKGLWSLSPLKEDSGFFTDVPELPIQMRLRTGVKNHRGKGENARISMSTTLQTVDRNSLGNSKVSLETSTNSNKDEAERAKEKLVELSEEYYHTFQTRRNGQFLSIMNS